MLTVPPYPMLGVFNVAGTYEENHPINFSKAAVYEIVKILKRIRFATKYIKSMEITLAKCNFNPMFSRMFALMLFGCSKLTLHINMIHIIDRVSEHDVVLGNR